MVLDIVCLILVGTSFYLGFTKGIIKTVFGILSILLALFASLKFSHLIIRLLDGFLDFDPRFNIIMGFVITFLLVMIAIRMIGHGLENVLETVHLNIFNKTAGGLSAGLMTLMVFSGLIWFLDQIKVISNSTKEDSYTYPVLKKMPEISREMIDGIKPVFHEFWDRTQKAMEKIDASGDSNDSINQ